MAKAMSSARCQGYIDGWRPAFQFPSGDLAQLIRAMWLDDFHQRPSMKNVVARLQVCVSLDDDATDEEGPSETAPPTNELDHLGATNRELQLENSVLKARLRQHEISHDSDRGILGGMYEFVPDRQGSILGQGASAPWRPLAPPQGTHPTHPC